VGYGLLRAAKAEMAAGNRKAGASSHTQGEVIYKSKCIMFFRKVKGKLQET
jgi:hypothetical protein